MSGEFALNAIGLVAGALGIIGFAKNNMPTQTDPAGAHVQVKIGLGEPGDSGNVAGGIDGVYAYDYNNAYIGRAQGGFIDVGGVLEVTVRQDTPGIQTDFLSVSATKDAPCISWISVSQYDGSPGGAWTGDIGKACGDYWYHAGGQEAGTFADPCPQEGCSWRPVCAWLDADHSADYPYGAMKFNVRAYGELSEDTVKAGEDHVCASTLWASDSGPINDKPAKREQRVRSSWMNSTLIVSSVSSQTATELCHHDKSWGPDFIGVDGKYCDMESKTVMPVCSDTFVRDCVEVDQQLNTLRKRTTTARRTVDGVHKTYDTIEQWD
ncbi:hypothetical protein PRZ48_005484 [Zasmidium cellare]|uniref:Uncharacterized protein n=1 Tax=Zasmidium cellare TaxID=395010 RepID=A0ABR0EU15_ZASCE|nr:hypothetical protein PRZ48_005484 [Zasmidium cellare]